MNNIKKFEGLRAGEIKKIERFVQKRDGRDSHVTGYGYNSVPDEMGFVKVRCEICSNDMEIRERDVIMYIYVPDRRRSFICTALSCY